MITTGLRGQFPSEENSKTEGDRELTQEEVIRGNLQIDLESLDLANLGLKKLQRDIAANDNNPTQEERQRYDLIRELIKHSVDRVEKGLVGLLEIIKLNYAKPQKHNSHDAMGPTPLGHNLTF